MNIWQIMPNTLARTIKKKKALKTKNGYKTTPSSHGNFIQPPAIPAAAIKPATDTTANTETVSKADTIIIDEEVMVIDSDTAISTTLMAEKDSITPVIIESEIDTIPEKATERVTTPDVPPVIQAHIAATPDVHVPSTAIPMKVDIAALDIAGNVSQIPPQNKPKITLYTIAPEKLSMARPVEIAGSY
jgi:hypothetical protein